MLLFCCGNEKKATVLILLQLFFKQRSSIFSNEQIMTNNHQYFMQLAINQAQQAQQLGEVPIGALVVHNNSVIAAAGNRRELWQDPTAHAEQIALRQAAQRMGTWRLEDSTLYVTLEPCVMCMGAIILARIPRLIYGANDPRIGAVGSIYDLSADERFNHKVDVTRGVMAHECGTMLSNFFSQLRQKKKTAKLSSGK